MELGKIIGSSPKKIILVHRYGADEKNWERTVWGIAPDLPGRIPVALAEAVRIKAEAIILFDYFSEKEGQRELNNSGRMMVQLMFEKIGDLKHFTVLPELKDFEENGREIIFELNDGRDRAANTAGELRAMEKIIKERGLNVTSLTCISSPDHVSRIIREAIIVFKDDPLAASLLVRASVTLYSEEDGITPPERATMSNVVVIEPRSDIGSIAQEMFGLDKERKSLALAEIKEVLKEHKK